jgi:hypothetical protein
MIVYHGSDQAVESPAVLENPRTLDLGPGFCTVSDPGKAAMFARRTRFRGMGEKAVVSSYETVPLESLRRDLSVLEFKEPEEAWMRYIEQNRSGPCSTVSHDVVYGPVAVGGTAVTLSLYKAGLYLHA